MKMLYIMLSINGIAEAYTPVGRMPMKACEEYAARLLMQGPVNMMARVDYKCVTK